MKYRIVVPAVALLLSAFALDSQAAQTPKESAFQKAVDKCMDKKVDAIHEQMGEDHIIMSDEMIEIQQSCEKEVRKHQSKTKTHKKTQ